MKNYTVSLIHTVEAENEEEALLIFDSRIKTGEIWQYSNAEVEEEQD